MAFYLSVIAFVIYNANMRTVTSADNAEAGYVAVNVVARHTAFLDEFYKPYMPVAPERLPDHVSYVQHARANYGTELGVFLSPIYWVLMKIGRYDSSNIDYDPASFEFNQQFRMFLVWAEKISVSFVAALTIGFFYLLLIQIFNSEKHAILGSVLYAFFTNHWTTSSQGLWRHCGLEIGLVAALYFLLKFDETREYYWMILAGLAAAPMAPIRPTGYFYLMAMSVYIFKRHREKIFTFLLFPAICIVAGVVFNASTANQSYLATSPIWKRTLPEVFAGLAGIFFSPSRGFFYYTPLYVFSFAGLWLVIKKNRLPMELFKVYMPVVVLLVILFGATFATGGLRWWAGWSWGPRYLVDVLPLLTIYLLVWIQELELLSYNHKMRWTYLAGVLAVWSVFTQFIGAFCYKFTWERQTWVETPTHLSTRLWDWKYNPIFVEIKDGAAGNPFRNFGSLIYAFRLRPVDFK